MRRHSFILLALFLLLSVPAVGSAASDFKLGVEVLLEERLDLLIGKRVGLITNPTGIDQQLRSVVDVLFEQPDIELKALYGPEHGVRGDAQAGKYVASYRDKHTGLPVYSLYGKTKKPTPFMLEDVDVLVFDIQDVGSRAYTYIYTMAYAMEAAKENHIPFIVLDRPNPLGGVKVEGPVLESSYSSFVGRYPIPIRHGMTSGELAQLFNESIDCDLTVIKMEGWKRELTFEDTPLEWVPPSPNLPTLDSAWVYPGTLLLEGTNLSEGRGTTKPFETIGAPFVDGKNLANQLNALGLPGVVFRPVYFTPQFSKHEGKLSGGVQIHVTDREACRPVETGLAILKTIYNLYPNKVEFTDFFPYLMGNRWVMEEIQKGSPLEEICRRWQEGVERFKEVRQEYLLYE